MMVSFRDVVIALEFFDQCERTLRGRVVRVTQSWKQAVFFIGRLLRRGGCKIANAASSSAHRAGRQQSSWSPACHRDETPRKYSMRRWHSLSKPKN